MKRNFGTLYFVSCSKKKSKRIKSYEVKESKDKPGFAICPACGDYHRIIKED